MVTRTCKECSETYAQFRSAKRRCGTATIILYQETVGVSVKTCEFKHCSKHIYGSASSHSDAIISFLPLISEALRSQKNPQFKRHVEAGQAGDRIRFCAAYVVNAVPALGYDPEDFIYSGLAGVLDFEGTAGRKAARVNGEDQSP